MLWNRFKKALDLSTAAALSKSDGPRVAVFDINGFDTHAAQGGSNGEHADKIYNLDKILDSCVELWFIIRKYVNCDLN